MNEKSLKDALNGIEIKGDMQQRLIRNIGRESRPSTFRGVKKTLIAACLVAVALFGTAFAVSADFREFVISFFKSEQIETPIATPPLQTVHPSDPEDTTRPTQEGIQYLGTQEIAGIADISYFQFENGFNLIGGIAAVRTEDGNLTIYSIMGDELQELPQQRINDVIRYRALNIPLSFVYVLDSDTLKTFDNTYDPQSGGQATAVSFFAKDWIWVNIAIRNEIDTYVLYNLKTSEIQDIVSEAGIELTRESQVVISPDRQALLIVHPHKVCLVNAETGELKALPELDSSNVLSASYIDNGTLSVWQRHDTDDIQFSIISYEIASGTKTVICENIPYYYPDSDMATGVMGLGKGITILVEQEQYVLIDEKTGERYRIEGITPDKDVIFLLNPDRNRILITTVGGQNGLGITQIGVIDMAERELKVFERKDFVEHETSIFWIGESEIAVTAYGESEYLYVYRFK